MSLNSILNIANSGLQTAQTQLRVVSDNVANVNTPGYVRKVAEQTSLTTQGIGAGVTVSQIRLATGPFPAVGQPERRFRGRPPGRPL